MPNTKFFGTNYNVPEQFILVKTRAVSPGLTCNFDYFDEDELIRNHHTYDDVNNVFVDHRYHRTDDLNEYDLDYDGIDRSTSRGFVVASEYDYDSRAVHLLIAVNKQFANLINAIETGQVNAVSVGASAFMFCSICGEQVDAYNTCDHIPYKIGSYIGDELVYKYLQDVDFYEISFVFDPADISALVYEVVS